MFDKHKLEKMLPDVTETCVHANTLSGAQRFSWSDFLSGWRQSLWAGDGHLKRLLGSWLLCKLFTSLTVNKEEEEETRWRRTGMFCQEGRVTSGSSQIVRFSVSPPPPLALSDMSTCWWAHTSCRENLLRLAADVVSARLTGASWLLCFDASGSFLDGPGLGTNSTLTSVPVYVPN